MSGYQGFTIATMPGNMLTDSIKNDLKMFISFLINTDMYRIFQGSNSDVWSKEALRICSQHMVSSINDTNNFESRKQMCAASAFAGKFLGLNTTYMYDLILHLYPVKVISFANKADLIFMARVYYVYALASGGG